MKKIIAIMAMMSFAATGSAFAADLTSGSVSGAAAEITGTKTGGSAVNIGKLSNNVKLGVRFDSTSYAFTTKHGNGSKKYGSSAGDTKIYVVDEAATTALVAPDSNNSGAFATGWTAL